MSKSTCCLFPLRANVKFTPGKFQFYSGQTPSLVGLNSEFTYGNGSFCSTFPSKCGQDTDQLKQHGFFRLCLSVQYDNKRTVYRIS